ncbi:MAG: S8 family serine peptidase [Acidimicrobiia bacterium]
MTRPAWSKDSAVLRLSGTVTLDDITPQWAFGGASGKGVRVAVIDSGIDADHPLLTDAIDIDAGVAVEIDDDGDVVMQTGAHDDSYGHGTACAGIIHSIAPQARLTSVRVLGAGNAGKTAGFLAGLEWAIEQRFDVINLSLGARKPDSALAFYELCDRAYFSGSFVVTAANNVAKQSYPSLFASVASVACNTATDPMRFHVNPDPPTEFLARGIDIDVAWRGGGYQRATGNSFAAPHISGLAALVKSKHPELRPFHIKTVLWACSANVGEALDPAATAGRLSRQIRMTRATRATRMAAAVMRRPTL